MKAQQVRLDALANNLANVSTTGYKRDVSTHKAFPEILLRRFNDNGVVRIPLSSGAWGSVDSAPLVGKLGGVEHNELFTVNTQGSLEQTENVFDLALQGDGYFTIETDQGERLTRNGNFEINAEGTLVTKEGFAVLGENGLISLKKHNFYIDQRGRIFINADLQDDPERLVSNRENRWENEIELDRLRISTVERPRYLQKQGSSLLRATEDSGEIEAIDFSEYSIAQGFLERANVNPVVEMVELIEVNRAYEANQRVIQAHDDSTAQLLARVLRV